MSKKNIFPQEIENLISSTEPEVISEETPSEDGIENHALTNFRNKQDLRAVFNMLLKKFDFIEVEGQLYIYNEEFGYWRLIPESNSNREIRKLATKAFFMPINRNSLSELYEWLLLEAPHKEESVFFQKTNYINFKNYAYNWNKDKLTTERKELYFRYSLDIEYPKEKSSGKFDEFIDDIFKSDKNSRKEFSKLIGLAISDIRNLKYMAFLYGPSNTGKTIIQKVLEFIVGAENCSSVSFSQMSNEFAITQLIAKRLNLSGEVSGATTNRLDIIKSITGNDKITACYKGKDHFQFRSNCLLVFACNCFPKINDFLEVQSFLERVVIFPFVNVKDRKDWDNNLLEKLQKDTAGIIKFAIDGLRALKEDDYSFKESKAMLDCKRYFSGIYDSFSIFADKYIESEKGAILTSSEISEMYHKFCNVNDYEILADNQWAQIIKRNYICYSTTKSVENENNTYKKRVRGYKGIKFKATISELYEDNVVNEPITQIPNKYLGGNTGD